MPGSGEEAILPRRDLTLHHAPPATLPRTHTITCPPLKEERRDWVNSLGRSRALNDDSCWTEDTTPTMPTRKHAPLRSRDTWHGWSPASRFSSIKLPGSRSRSTRSHDMRFSSTRSYDPRHYSIRSRASLNPSVRGRSSLRSLASRASSTLHRSFRHTGPIYRVATSRARAAREWAGTFREQISSKGGTLLLTPARGRHQPEVVATRGSPTPEPARNSPWVHATRRAASASRTVHWEVASGLAALFECGATAGSAAAVGVGRVCSAAAAMADGKLQQLRRSISSWSLSTVKKPKITVPKFKAPKIKAFRGKRNRVEPKDDAAALEEVKAALLKAEGEAEDQGSGAAAGETSSEVIHEPLVDGSQEGQPTIVLTVHEHKNPPEPPSPPPSPGLLAVNDDFEYIDSDEGDTGDRVVEAVRPDLDYSDQWFDAHGTLTRSKEDMVDILNGLDDDQVSKYYDFVDYTAPKQEKPETPPKDKPVKGGSQKARDWVKSFDEKAESRIQKLLKFNKSKTSSNLPKSKSEIRLDQIDDVPEKWSKRDEIKLNTLSKDASLQDKGQKLTPEKDKSSRKENLKKIFQVRGKLSIKPIVDSQRPSYTNTDIHIAAAPYALANTSATAEKTESLDVSEDGLNCTSDDLDNTNEGGPRSSTPQQHDEASAPLPPSSPIKQDTSEITRESKVATVLDVSNDKQLGEGIFEKEATETIETPHLQSQDVLAKDTTNITITSVEDKTNSTEGTMDSKTCLPLSQVAPVQDNKASTIINLAGNQTKSMKEVTDANKAFPSQPHDAPAHNNAADTTINAAENLLKSTEEVTDDRNGSAPQARAVSVQNATTNNVTNSSGNQMKATKEVIDDGKACPSQPQEAPVQDTTTNITTNDTEQQAQAAVHDERKPVEENIKCATIECKETDTESKTDLFKSTPGENANFSEQPEQRSVDAREPKEEKEPLLATQDPNGVDSTELPKTETKETKKSKFSGNNFPKSIKNFAGSVFSPQFGGKAKTEIKGNDSLTGDKKKKKGRLNPFSKESLFKSSVKEKSDSVKEIPQKENETKDSDKTEGEKLLNKNNLNPFEDDKENPPCDEAPSPPENNNDSVEAKRDAVIVEDSALCATTSDLPDVLHSNGISSTGRTSRSSSISLEFVSQVDSDEMKTVSHESSPEMDSSFVEEDGLRLRKDALLAIKAMDIDPDDTNTQFYSFASAVEDFQAPKREEDLQPTASTKKMTEPTAEPKIQEAETNKLQRKEEKTTEKMQEETPQKLRESLTQEKEKTPEKRHLESPQKRSESLTREEGRTSEKKHESQQQLSDPSTNIRSSEETAIKTDTEEENLQRKMNELNKRNNEEVTSQKLINGPSPTVPDTPSKQESPPRCVQTASEPPEEIPKLKLDPATPSECQEAPRPSPRTKKGRYGYSTVGTRSTTPSNRDPSVSDYSENTNNSSAKSAGSSLTATYPRRNTTPEKVPPRKAGVKRTPSDSGYAGPASSSCGGSDVEPIYWEISESREAPPKPSPRTKKSHRTPSDATPKSKETAPPQSQTAVPEESPKKKLPEWINTRAPIPSPRGKKQRSLQSLPCVVPDDNNMETMKKKLQMLSREPLPDVAIPQSPPIVKKREEDQFYSGKAASISYGFTPTRAPPPSPPSRVRKASQISLPAAMAAEEAQCRQQKRRSLYVSPDGEAAPEPPSPRRARRRTDPIKVITQRNIQSAVKTEELLTDVLYSVHSLMGGTAAGVWKVGGESDLGGPSTRGEVHMEQIIRVLQAAFQINQETIDRLRADIRSKPPPEVNLQLSIKEASDLRPKTVKGTTNPYVIVSVGSSNTSHRTRLEKDTLRPKWNQEFTLPVGNLQKEVIRLEVWHEHDPVKMKQALTAVRDIKGMSRLVRGTTAQVQHQTSHLLGQVIVSVKDLTERGADGWFMLEKNEERSKERGKIHLAGTVTSKAQLENKSRQSYDALLARLIHHQLTCTNNNNEQSEWSRPWDGHLSGPGAASLAQYAIMLDLSDAALQLAWWKVCSRIPTADAVWVLSRLQEVQAAISKNLYQDEELLELRSSFCSFIRDHTERLKNLHKTFPPSSGIIARRQLTFTLKALQCMQNHAGTRALLDLEGLPPLHEMVTSSLATHAKNWWMTVIEELRGVRTTDEQISHVINIVKESHSFLSIAANAYDSIFMKEMNIPYMQTTYLMVSKKVNPCVRPLVMNIYNRLPSLDTEEEEETECEYRLEVGTSLWELYMNLGRLYQLSERLPAEARAESGVREYHRWFSKGVLRWLELAMCRARSMIKRAVELDMLEPQDKYCKFSSSASDTLGIFNDIKIWWQKLAWPDLENSAVLLTKILDNICSCVLCYSNLIREKVESIFHQYENSTRVFITEQICVGLNNIERVRTEMVKLPTQFGFSELLQKIRESDSGGESAATQLDATVERLIVSAAENTEAKLNEFIDTMLDKMQPTLERAVNEACEERSTVLAQVLDPSLELTMNQLNNSNFKRFLWRVWEVVVDIFTATVMRNSERRKANYFGGVHTILEETLKFFSPPDGKGLDETTAKTPAYTSLMELLESLRMSSESLIAQYYQERYEEQMEEILPCKARLYVKILFTKPGKLIVEVIMAKDMVVEADACSITSRGGGLGLHTSHQPVDSYVKVQLVPQEWFPATAIRKTKTQRKQDPAVYEETFEYEMNKTDDGVRAGFLLLTLKDYNLGFSNTFIGEAVIPLSSLPCVDSSEVHTVTNSCLTMTTPGLDIGYKSLRALQFRTGDKVASAFIKKVSKRLIEPKGKANTSMGKSNDDKARSKSPNMRERLKLS